LNKEIGIKKEETNMFFEDCCGWYRKKNIGDLRRGRSM
jgi:hypothetical protein